MLDIAPGWAGGIDEFVAEANTWLARILPDDRAARPKDEVNARLVRHYTTLGLLPAPRREGREARYDRSHLLHLLALRRLMADGLGGRALAGTLAGRTDAQLERLAEWGAGDAPEDVVASLPVLAAVSPALDYVQRLRAGAEPGRVQRVVPEIRELFRAEREPARPRAQALLRAMPRPGLEVLVGERFRWPRDGAAWDTLMDELRESLVDVRAQQRAASGDDT